MPKKPDLQRCLAGTCDHAEHQVRPFEEIEGEHPDKRALRRMVSGIPPARLATFGIV